MQLGKIGNIPNIQTNRSSIYLKKSTPVDTVSFSGAAHGSRTVKKAGVSLAAALLSALMLFAAGCSDSKVNPPVDFQENPIVDESKEETSKEETRKEEDDIVIIQDEESETPLSSETQSQQAAKEDGQKDTQVSQSQEVQKYLDSSEARATFGSVNSGDFTNDTEHYDSEGRLIAIVYRDTYGSGLQMPLGVDEFEYDEKGNLAGIYTYEDGTGKLLRAQEFTYNNDGTLKEKTDSNKNSTLTQSSVQTETVYASGAFVKTSDGSLNDVTYFRTPSANEWTGSKNANEPYADQELEGDGSLRDVTYFPKPDANSWEGSKNANEPYADQDLTGDGSLRDVRYYYTPDEDEWEGSKNANEPYADQELEGDGSLRDVTYFPKPDEDDWIGIKE